MRGKAGREGGGRRRRLYGKGGEIASGRVR